MTSRSYSVGNILTTDTKTTAYTVPTGYTARWNLSYVVNHSGNNKSVSIFWYDSSQDMEIHVVANYVLSPTQFLMFDSGAYVMLEEGDEIRIQIESAAEMHTINTFELIRN